MSCVRTTAASSSTQPAISLAGPLRGLTSRQRATIGGCRASLLVTTYRGLIHKLTLALLVVLLVAACRTATSPETTASGAAATPEGLVTAADFGSAWPFSVASGTLRCHGDQLTFSDDRDDIEWALNGTAEANGWPELDDTIWLDDPSTGHKKSVAPLTSRALALC